MGYNKMEMPEFTFVEDHEVIRPAQKEGGWTLEFNKIVWGSNGDPKYDIRMWSPDHTHMGKGIGLSKDDCIKLKEILNRKFNDVSDEYDFPPEDNVEEPQSDGGLEMDVF